MSMTPSVPDFKAGLKSFWQRPEGKTGALVLLATVCAGLYGASLLLPWAIAFATDMLHLAILGVSLFVVVYTVTNKTFRSIVSNLFQLSMRWTTSLLVEIDPIGILENTIDRMRENSEKLGKAVAGCNGAKVSVQSQMSKNSDAIRHAKSLADQADKQLAASHDTLMQQRFNLSKTMQLQEIGRRMHSNDKLQSILGQTTKMYNLLVRWQQLGEFNVENMQAEVNNAKEERKAILSAYAGMGFAQKLIKGDPEQMKMLNASLEYLATDNANKLGAMEDFARYSEKYLTSMDLEQGASSDDAEKMLNEYEHKLLSAGSTDQSTVQSTSVSNPVPVPRGDDPYWK